jgi:itaconate CoA-transferase
VGTPVADIASGLYAYSGILAALYRRATDPHRRGAHLEVSMLDDLGDWMGWIIPTSR